MPLYEYRCKKCQTSVEQIRKYEDLMKKQRHTGCGGALEYVPGFQVRGEQRQMGAILSNGARVPGHFGKDARRNRKKR